MKARQLRLARKRAAPAPGKPDPAADPPADSDTVVGSPPLPVATKRLNPFSSLPLTAKRRLMSGMQPTRTIEESPTGGSGGEGTNVVDGGNTDSSPTEHSALLKVLDEASSTAVVISSSDSAASKSTSSPTDRFRETESGSDSQPLQAFSPFATVGDIGFRECGRTLPTDWTPKTRVRLVSCNPFACCSSLPRTIDEARALQSAASAVPLPVTDANVDDFCADPVVKLQRALLYWCSPCLPGCDPCPWTSEREKPTASSPMTLPVPMKAALRDGWGSSFESAYGLMKSSAMPYFYLMAHSFVALFRSAAGTARSEIASEMTAVLTPTTAGLRRALRTGGVEFGMMPPKQLHLDGELTKSVKRRRMPGAHGDERDSGASSQASRTRHVDDAEPVEGHTGEVDDDPSAEDAMPDDRWLESLGVSKDSLPGLQLSTSMRQSEAEASMDGRPVSAIYVRGAASVHGLFNFLLNYAGCFAPTGVRAGMPPTIVAPAPFLNASLQRMKYRCLKLRTVDGALVAAGPESAVPVAAAGPSRKVPSAARATAVPLSTDSSLERWMMEVNGPILPCTAQLLLQLAQMQGQCYALLGVQNGTEPFNAACDAAFPTDEQKAGSQTSGGLGGHPAVLQSAATAPRCSTLRELSYSNDTWYWK